MKDPKKQANETAMPEPAETSPAPREEELVLVRFVVPAAPYCAGETAGFARDRAAELVDAGLAALAEEPVTLPAKGDKLKEDLVLVRFLKSRTPYLVGETAAFPRSQAEQLVKDGIAAEVRP
jgi:hypothetical protein